MRKIKRLTKLSKRLINILTDEAIDNGGIYWIKGNYNKYDCEEVGAVLVKIRWRTSRHILISIIQKARPPRVKVEMWFLKSNALNMIEPCYLEEYTVGKQASYAGESITFKGNEIENVYDKKMRWQIEYANRWLRIGVLMQLFYSDNELYDRVLYEKNIKIHI